MDKIEKYRNEIVRKFVHITFHAITLIGLLFLDKIVFYFFFIGYMVFYLILDLYRIRGKSKINNWVVKLMGPVIRPWEKKSRISSASYSLIGLFVTSFFPLQIASLCIIYSGLGDPFSKLGKIIFKNYTNEKLRVFLVFFIISFIFGFLFWLIYSDLFYNNNYIDIVFIFLGALCSAFIDYITLKIVFNVPVKIKYCIDDNYTIPIFTAIFLFLVENILF